MSVHTQKRASALSLSNAISLNTDNIHVSIYIYEFLNEVKRLVDVTSTEQNGNRIAEVIFSRKQTGVRRGSIDDNIVLE